jgi:hypothetical protein
MNTTLTQALNQPWPGVKSEALLAAEAQAAMMEAEQFALLRESHLDGDKLCIYKLDSAGALHELRRFDATPEGELYAKSALAALRGQAAWLELMSKVAGSKGVQ